MPIPGITASGVSAAFDPVAAFAWHSVFWASDPLWSNPGDGNAVSTWRNGGSDGVAMTQATGSLQPLYRSAYANLNSQPAVQFDGTDDLLANTYNATLAVPYSVVSVCHFITVGGAQIAVLGLSNQCYAGCSGTAWRLRSITLLTGGTASTGKHLHRALIASGATDALEVDGTSVMSAVEAGNVAMFQIGVGQAANLTTDAFNGAIAFVGAFPGDISADANWAAFKAWAASLYSMTIA